jgi:primary-amine oxidase
MEWMGVRAEARCVLYERPARQTWVVTVCLDDAAVIRKVLVPDVQPPLMAEEWTANTDQIKADPGFRAALARRGLTDMSMIQVDPWPASNFGLDIDASGRRLARGVAYLLDGPGSNPYARPVENLVAVLDRDTGEVLEIQDGEVVPIPGDGGRYDAASVAEPARWRRCISCSPTGRVSPWMMGS